MAFGDTSTDTVEAPTGAVAVPYAPGQAASLKKAFEAVQDRTIQAEGLENTEKLKAAAALHKLEARLTQLIMGAGLPADKTSQLLADMRSDLGGLSGLSNPTMIQNIIADIQEELRDSDDEEATHKALTRLHQQVAAEEAKHKASKKESSWLTPSTLFKRNNHDEQAHETRSASRQTHQSHDDDGDGHKKSGRKGRDDDSFSGRVYRAKVAAVAWVGSAKKWVEETAVETVQAVQVTAVQTAAVGGEAVELVADVSRRAGTAASLAVDVVTKTVTGDFDAAGSKLDLAKRRAGDFINKASTRAAKSMDDIGDVGRDKWAGFSDLGKEVKPILADFQKYARIYDTDRDGKVELHEVVNKLKSRGISDLKDMNGNGRVDIQDVAKIYDARLPGAKTKQH